MKRPDMFPQGYFCIFRKLSDPDHRSSTSRSPEGATWPRVRARHDHQHLYDVTAEQLGGDWTELLHVNFTCTLQCAETPSNCVNGRQTHTNISKEPFCSVG